MTKERIEIIRQSLIPFVKKELLDINYDGLGKSDAKEFEKDLNEVLDLANKALEQRPSDDCVSRAEVNKLYDEYRPRLATHVSEFGDKLKALPPVTPTFPKGATNGDMIKAMFPKDYIYIYDRSVSSWWNAPYKRGRRMRLIDAEDYLYRERPVGLSDELYEESHLYKSIMEQEVIQAIPLDKVKQAREEIENINEVVHDGTNHYYKDCVETKKEVLAILDNLIAESEEK